MPESSLAVRNGVRADRNMVSGLHRLDGYHLQNDGHHDEWLPADEVARLDHRDGDWFVSGLSWFVADHTYRLMTGERRAPVAFGWQPLDPAVAYTLRVIDGEAVLAAV